ncbi:MAG TPA: hypothetical protein VGC63_07395 [Solirubrobacterales bacterium]|jgi:hypothetical protein
MADSNGSRTFFHSCPADADPQQLLDPDRQVTEPWGEPEHGPCDKCGGGGEVLYACRSCLEAGAVADCPACQGRVRFRETCPTCLGEGRIERTRRHGVAVFPTPEGLYRYLAERNANVIDRLIVEVEGRLADERDLDADAGALLVHPEAIGEVKPLDPELIARIRARL